jgi:hypothetical protein
VIAPLDGEPPIARNRCTCCVLDPISRVERTNTHVSPFPLIVGSFTFPELTSLATESRISRSAPGVTLAVV